ncbi:hypothetical protein RhiirA4_496179 [Rhizophagus irregularis]|uniref:Hsp70 family protein n=1 Tax=Rhizophagus irregularis TaxID=588596 RepID=A0A2I1H076_9GLOM|nr:hypothetical protein RhiirA4_496179 [Rhizophagus irregularis]
MDIRAGFAYAYRSSPEIITNDSWPQQIGPLKTNTVLQYDSNYQNVTKWGNPALAQRQSRRNGDSSSSKTVELFKLHLGNIPQNEKPPLPRQLSYDKAISDYLRELGKLIKETISTRWQGIKFFEHVLLVISIPAEFDDRAKDTMRKCLYNAGLTNSKESNKVEFTTEPEAAAIYCMRNLEGQNKPISINESFMVVDCGGGTVDLTTRKLLRDNKLSEITERTGGFSESKYLQMRVKEEFGKLVPSIIIPKQPIAAIVRGACDYGLKMSTIIDRTLKYSYGFETYRSWKFGDPINRRKSIKGNNKTKIMIFHCLATRGTTVGIDEEFRTVSCPSMPDQTEISYPIYITTESSAKFCDESGMKLHGTLTIDLPDVHLGLDRQVEFSLIFGKMELVAKAKNLRNGRIYNTSFDLNLNF